MAFSIPFLPRSSRKPAPAASPRLSRVERLAAEREAALDAWAAAVTAEADADFEAARAVEAWAYTTDRPVSMMTLWREYNDLRYAGAGVLGSRD